MSLGKNLSISSRHLPERKKTVPLANIFFPTEIADLQSLNEQADLRPGFLAEYSRLFDRLHSENHTTAGRYNIWCGEANKGESSTTLGEKLTNLGTRTSVYGHGSYVMQARPEEAGDLEANYPLGIAVFWPGNPEADRTPEKLLLDPVNGRDERGFEGTTMQYWNVRAPNGSVAQIVDASTPDIGTTPRSGTQCLAVTRGETPGQMLVSTGLTVGTAKAVAPGDPVDFQIYTRAQFYSGRTVQAEIRWMDSSYNTVDTFVGTPIVSNSSEWLPLSANSIAPEGTSFFAVQVRWLGPPAQGETHYLDDATATSGGGRLVSNVTPSQTFIELSGVAGLRPSLELPTSWPYRAPRASDPQPTTTTTSSNTSSCVHWLRINDEIMAITGVSVSPTNVVTIQVVRGMWGTTAASHSVGAKVYSPVYVGSISEGADATFAGSPAVNDSSKALRYSLALEQRMTMPQLHRATEWISKRRAMQILEYDMPGNPNGIPQNSSVAAWSNYTEAGTDLKSVNSVYLDITGTSFYNMSDAYGYNATPWTLVGVPEVSLPADSMMNSQALASAQKGKALDMRQFMQNIGLFNDSFLIGNNLAMQSNSQDPDKQSIVASGALDLSVFEFWINKPNTQPAKYKLQRQQLMTCCVEDLPVAVWAKSGQNGLVGTPFDSTPTGAGNIDQTDLNHYRRWAYAHFLMCWRGSAQQQFMTEWGFHYYSTMDPLFTHYLGLPLGEPESWDELPVESISGLKYREYGNGIVYINDTANPVEVYLPKSMRDLTAAPPSYVWTKIIPAWDALVAYAL